MKKILLTTIALSTLLNAQTIKFKFKEYTTFNSKPLLREYSSPKVKLENFKCKKRGEILQAYLQEEATEIEDLYIPEYTLGNDIIIGYCYDDKGILNIKGNYASFIASKKNRYYEVFSINQKMKKSDRKKTFYFKRKNRSVKIIISKW